MSKAAALVLAFVAACTAHPTGTVTAFTETFYGGDGGGGGGTVNPYVSETAQVDTTVVTIASVMIPGGALTASGFLTPLGASTLDDAVAGLSADTPDGSDCPTGESLGAGLMSVTLDFPDTGAHTFGFKTCSMDPVYADLEPVLYVIALDLVGHLGSDWVVYPVRDH
jgi:hypothetical protein